MTRAILHKRQPDKPAFNPQQREDEYTKPLHPPLPHTTKLAHLCGLGQTLSICSWATGIVTKTSICFAGGRSPRRMQSEVIASSPECRHTNQMPLKEVEHHPEFPYVNWDLKPSQQGLTPVGEGRGGPFKISWEIHGHGPTKILFIMGLGSLKNAWQRQTKDFGHTQGSKYSIMIVDNRGMGDSDKPMIRYSTSEMARDYLELLEHVGWTGQRELHVVGISMGGMIAQEIAVVIPHRLCSLTLLSTFGRLSTPIGTAHFLELARSRLQLFLPKSLAASIALQKRNMFSSEWLEAADDTEYTIAPFPTNGDRFSAYEIHKRGEGDKGGFSPHGFALQAVAAAWHRKTPAQLAELAGKVGRRRIVVAHGTEDKMITFEHGRTLWSDLSNGGKEGEECEFVVFRGNGHVVIMEKREDIRKLIEETVERTRAMN